jgi:hypothetical protein
MDDCHINLGKPWEYLH